MHEFTTMYHYFKGVSDSAPNKVIVDLKSEMARKTSTVSPVLIAPQSPTLMLDQKSSSSGKQPEYMEMHSRSNSGGSDTDPYGLVNGVTNLNYINVEDEEEEDEVGSADVCDGAQLQFTEPETTNELNITEPAYFDSKDANKTDQFSEECSDLLDNASVMLMLTPQQHRLQQSTEQQLRQQQDDLMSDYLIQPSNRPVTVDDGFGDYLTHPSNKPIYPAAASAYMNDDVVAGSHEGSHMKLTFAKKAGSCSLNTTQDTDPMNTSTSSSVRTTSSQMLKRQESETSKASVDDELLEIINDFKNNVFTINEVEQLVSTWKNRNDVQQSFKDKERQLQKMRHEYDRLQTQMKDHMKRPTPFERVRKLFSRSKSEDKDGTAAEDKFNTSGHRPASSLSLHSVASSTSSGRMSTGSVCSGTSLGDSGTHSDHDERRPNCRVGTPGSLLMDNYMIPPAPRPVSTPTEERFGSPSEHYIIFPSNAPVFPQAQQQHDYMNFGGACSNGSGLNTIDENKEADIHTIKIQKPKDVIYAPVMRKTNPCSSFRNLGPKANIVGNDQVAYGKFNGGGQQQAKDIDEEVMMRNQNQSVKEMRDQKMFSRQNSMEANNEQGDEHCYMNLSV